MSNPFNVIEGGANKIEEPAKHHPLVYIVMRNHNAFPLTCECLQSLSKLTYPNYRILVVDDSSRDDSADRIVQTFPAVSVIRTGKYLEYCKGLNFGIRQALRNGAEYVFLVNNDTKDFSANYLEEVVGAFEENGRVGLVGSWCYDYDGKLRWQGVAKEKLGVSMETPTEGFIVKREVFEAIGLLNERLVRYFEDLDFIVRLRKAGYDTTAVPSVSFAHLGSGTSKRQAFVPNYYRVRNLIMFLRKYCSDKPFGWRVKTFRRYLRVHVDRLKESFRKRDFKSFIKIGSSIAIGLAMGFVVPWRDENEL